MFVAVGGTDSGTRTATSIDGIEWTLNADTIPGIYVSVCYGDGVFVAVGSAVAMSSKDGFTWVKRTAASGNLWPSVCYGNGMFVSVSNSGSDPRVMTSQNDQYFDLSTVDGDIGIENVIPKIKSISGTFSASDITWVYDSNGKKLTSNLPMLSTADIYIIR